MIFSAILLFILQESWCYVISSSKAFNNQRSTRLRPSSKSSFTSSSQHLFGSQIVNPTTTLFSQSQCSPTSRYFQLEEKEDSESCTTELFLSANGSVSLSETNGPPPVSASGVWKMMKDGNSFQMNIRRTFSAGMSGSGPGEIFFDVERSYEGILSSVGASFAVEGSIYLVDELIGDYEVGYFSMIDTTNVKLGDDSDI